MSNTGTHVGIVQFAAPNFDIDTVVESQLTGSLSSLEMIIPTIAQIGGTFSHCFSPGFLKSQKIGNTPTGAGLEFAQLNVFAKTGRSSDQYPHVIVLITDGKSNQGVDPVQIATILKTKYHVSIVCVGVGNDINLPELQAIASPPISLTVFAVSDWPALQAFLKTIVSTSCNIVCPGGCSGHGRCLTSNATCICDPGFQKKNLDIFFF